MPFGCNCPLDDFERWLKSERERVVQAEASTADVWARAYEASPAGT